MSPRADFECQHCQARYEDLPVQCVRCPVCARKRGFRRLFDAVNVASKAVAAFVDPLLKPALEKRDEIRASQEVIRRDSIKMIPASTAMGAVDAGGRAASRSLTVPIFRTLQGPRPGAGSRSD